MARAITSVRGRRQRIFTREGVARANRCKEIAGAASNSATTMHDSQDERQFAGWLRGQRRHRRRVAAAPDIGWMSESEVARGSVEPVRLAMPFPLIGAPWAAAIHFLRAFLRECSVPPLVGQPLADVLRHARAANASERHRLRVVACCWWRWRRSSRWRSGNCARPGAPPGPKRGRWAWSARSALRREQGRWHGVIV